MITEVRYLSEYAPEKVSERQIGDRIVPVDARGYPVKTAPVAPLLVEHEPLNYEVRAGWGDRVGGAITPDLPVYLAGENGRQIPVPPEEQEAFDRVAAVIRAAWRADRLARPEVDWVCTQWEAILAKIDREYAEHEARWQQDAVAIARKFRRKFVEVGEQTVPGKCVVRSSRGKPLGYAHFWDGRWLGTVERYAA